MKKKNSKGEFLPFSEARVKIIIGKQEFYSASEGNGPIHALDKSLRNALIKYYPSLKIKPNRLQSKDSYSSRWYESFSSGKN